MLPSKRDGKTIDYVDRVNRALTYVLQHLEQPLPLEVVARAAHFSPFHFHRIFRLLVGESLSEFVKRVRLERALSLMSRRQQTTRRRPSLTEIAFACGFSSSADFTRCFRQRYGTPPSRFDLDAFRHEQRARFQDAAPDPAQRNLLAHLGPGLNPDRFRVTLRRLAPRWVAYTRVWEPFRPGAVARAATQMVAWAEARGLADAPWLGYMWDDPEITAPELCRYDIGLEIPARLAGNEVSQLEFPAMRVAEVELRGGIDLEMRALDWLYGTWLPASGYAPSDQPCFEAWQGRPFAHGLEHFELRLQLPIGRG